MEIARETDLPDLLSSLGYTVKKVGSCYTTKEMDSLRIWERRRWYRFSSRQHGDAITFLQEFCGKSFPEAVNYLLAYHGRTRDSPASLKNGADKRASRFRFAACPYRRAKSVRLPEQTRHCAAGHSAFY